MHFSHADRFVCSLKFSHASPLPSLCTLYITFGEYSGVLAQNFRVVARGVGKNEVNVLCPFIFLDLQSTAGDYQANS